MGRYLKFFGGAFVASLLIFGLLSSTAQNVFSAAGGIPGAPSSNPSPTPDPTNPGQGHTQVIVCHAEPVAEGQAINRWDRLVIDDDGGPGNSQLQGHRNHPKDLFDPTGGICPQVASTPDPSGDPETSTPTPEPTVYDVCANIDGVQTSVPDGLHLDASGRNCVAYQLGGPPTGGNSGGAVLGSSSVSDPGQVLGASTTAKTGMAEDVIGSLLVVVGLTTTLTSAYVYHKAFAYAYRKAFAQ